MILREMLARYEHSVRVRQRELEKFRENAERYIADSSSEIDRGMETINLIREQISKSVDKSDSPAPEVPSYAHALDEIGVGKENQSEIIRRAVREILKASERPLKRAEIKRRLDERGIVIASSDPLELIRAALRRGPEFSFVPHKGYALHPDER
jgi:hypothetical protein